MYGISADENTLYLTDRYFDVPSVITCIDLREQTHRNILPDSSSTQYKLSPDHTGFAYIRLYFWAHNNLCSWDPGTGQTETAINANTIEGKYYPQWIHGGKNIVYMGTDTLTGDSGLWIADPESKSTHLFWPLKIQEYDISDDARSIVIQSSVDLDSKGNIYVINTVDSTQTFIDEGSRSQLVNGDHQIVYSKNLETWISDLYGNHHYLFKRHLDMGVSQDTRKIAINAGNELWLIDLKTEAKTNLSTPNNSPRNLTSGII